MNNTGKVSQVDIRHEMKKSYIDYAMSVIVSRALPDVRDGLKPVHRRILYSMHELGLTPEKGYRKCARIVGDVLGKYHPHGDSAVYEALVRMAQDFSIRHTLVDGHGNFGSVDGDSAAAMRYTEAKMDKITPQLLRDINKNTVDFIPNFDGEEEEPSVLPSRFPNLLVNGSSGIAVGMATNIPPHNLAEVINGIDLLIDNPDCTIADLMTEIKGPDFPTAGIILGKAGIRSTYETGRGRILVRAKTEIEEHNNRQRIIVNELPYQVNKARLIEAIANLVKDKKLDGISDLRDESDREGMRIVIDLKRDANANVVLNRLYKHTRMQETFGAIMLALVDGEPKVLNLKDMLRHYLDFQKEIIVRRTTFDLNKALDRAHILEGLRIALDHIDEVIALIRASKTTAEAKEGLMTKFNLSERQTQAILEMRLQRLTGLEREKIEQEYNELMELIAELRAILNDEKLVLDIIKNELQEIKNKYADPRRTAIDATYIDSTINIEDLIDDEQVVITLTHNGYVKRLPADTYSAQKRGGKGIQAMTTREDDFVEHVFITSTLNTILLFSNKGRAYTLKTYEIPEAGRTAKGVNIVNLVAVDSDEKIQAALALKEFKDDHYLVMGTKKGIIKKTSLSAYSSIRKNGVNAINLREDDELVGVRPTTGESEILFITRNGYSIRFSEEGVRPVGRTATGVKAITLRENDEVVSMEVAKENEELLVVSENGFGKKTPVSEYPVRNRGGKGVITYKVSEKTGNLVGARIVDDSDEMMLINNNGIAIRLNVSGISSTGRNAMGVKLMRSDEEDQVVAIAKINCIDDKDQENSSEETETDNVAEDNSVQENQEVIVEDEVNNTEE
ncbi:DNA gyrase subunit A [Clostridium collagenovorans DSM 3089]|uniref:DNA gyrase subunit A n=1 Tax=Clostridium collagenovorans DSM 3089 TaxID=1121306 RepID=A0A1M5YGN7_9CLOT|nr:DNA gyrase subunit A [Clostridium collagenovorans]SHI11231.1 DNA gyrase subunit A [Clostridium collagenovorans DSM 3089]